jgi:hypothetical protein
MIKVEDTKYVGDSERHVVITTDRFSEVNDTPAKQAAVRAAVESGLAGACFSSVLDTEMLDIQGKPIPDAEVEQRIREGNGPVAYRATFKLLSAR